MRFAFYCCLLAACTQSGSTARITFDPCEAVGVTVGAATAAQVASVDAAIELWRVRGVTAFSAGTAGVEVVFRDGAQAVYGFYDDETATVFVNTDVTDASERAVTIAHELGHALGLVHVSASERASVMNPGNLQVDPTDEDVATLRSQWGSCAAP